MKQHVGGSNIGYPFYERRTGPLFIPRLYTIPTMKYRLAGSKRLVAGVCRHKLLTVVLLARDIVNKIILQLYQINNGYFFYELTFEGVRNGRKSVELV